MFLFKEINRFINTIRTIRVRELNRKQRREVSLMSRGIRTNPGSEFELCRTFTEIMIEQNTVIDPPFTITLY